MFYRHPEVVSVYGGPETIKDLVKIKKALDNPRSEFFQYAVKNFGYCSKCESVTEYLTVEIVVMMGTKTVIFCKKCRYYFGLHGNRYGRKDYVTNRDDVSENLVNKFKRHIKKFNLLRSRQTQRRFFKAALKKILRKSAGESRRLESLR